ITVSCQLCCMVNFSLPALQALKNCSRCPFLMLRWEWCLHSPLLLQRKPSIRPTSSKTKKAECFSLSNILLFLCIALLRQFMAAADPELRVSHWSRRSRLASADSHRILPRSVPAGARQVYHAQIAWAQLKLHMFSCARGNMYASESTQSMERCAG